MTLLFLCEQYLAAAKAYLRGIERRIQTRLNPDVYSLTTVFISRWDKATMGSLTSPESAPWFILISIHYAAPIDAFFRLRYQGPREVQKCLRNVSHSPICAGYGGVLQCTKTPSCGV